MKLDGRYVISEKKDIKCQAIHCLQEQIHHFSFLSNLTLWLGVRVGFGERRDIYRKSQTRSFD